MNGTYVGRLSTDDPLHGFLTRIARDRMGVQGNDSYRVFRLSGLHEVYRYEGRNSSTRIIGKFFGPRFPAEMSRGISRRQLRLYPHVRAVLDVLRAHLPLAVVTDAQTANARGELHQVGLLGYFDPIVVSGDHGFRKPDARLFRYALDALGVAPEQAVHVGNDMYRDVFGACEVGVRTVLFDSDQGTKEHPDTAPDHTIADHRELLDLLGLPRPS